jgi:hypothetical protein
MNNYPKSRLVTNFQLFLDNPINDCLFPAIHTPSKSQVIAHVIKFTHDENNQNQKILERVKFIQKLMFRNFPRIVDAVIDKDELILGYDLRANEMYNVRSVMFKGGLCKLGKFIDFGSRF